MIDDYIVLTDDTLSLVMEKTGWPLEACVQLMTKANRMKGRFVVFCVHSTWRRVFIYHRYDEKKFMISLRDRLMTWAKKGN